MNIKRNFVKQHSFIYCYMNYYDLCLIPFDKFFEAEALFLEMIILIVFFCLTFFQNKVLKSVFIVCFEIIETKKKQLK